MSHAFSLRPDPGALSGLLVLDFGQAAVGPVAACYLGMMGATVIKVEQPSGDSVRRGQPTMRGTSTTFVGNNLTKRGVVLDLKTPQGLQDAKRLAAKADILLENFRTPDIMPRLGLGYDEVLSRLNPRLVYLQSSAFGPLGPWSGMFSNEWMTESVSGCVSASGSAGGLGEFTRGSALLDWNGAMLNTAACLAALLQRERTGRGQMLRASQFGSSIFCGMTRIAEFLAGGESARPLGSGSAWLVPDQAFRASDGFVNVCVPGEKFWPRLCQAVGAPALADDRRFADNAARVKHRDALVAALAPQFADRTVQEWLAVLRAADVPCGANEREATLTAPQLRDAQVAANGMLTRIESDYGTVLTQAPHWSFEKTPAAITRPSPTFGQHTQEVLQAIDGWTPWAVSPATNPSDAKAGALAGIKVVEFAAGVCGPLAGMVLEQLGATVVRVQPEKPEEDDWLRGVGPEVGDQGATHALLNARKQVIRADLKTAEGRRRIRAHLQHADIVLVGLREHKLSALGLAREQVRELNPGAIYCHIGAWGRQGPHAATGASELLVQAVAGVPRYLGSADGEPVRLGFDVVSVSTAFSALQASLAALLHRQRGGPAQCVDVNMLASAIAINQWSTVADSQIDRIGGRQLLGQDWPPDYGFACREGRCLIDFRDATKWRSLAIAVGRVDLLNDAGFARAVATHPGLVVPYFESSLGQWSLAAIERLVRDELGGTVVPVLDIAGMLAHPQSQVLGIVQQTQDGLSMRLPITSTGGLLRGEAVA